MIETNKKSELRLSYDQIYSSQVFSEPEYYYRWIVNLLAPTPGKKLLDIACGAGFFLAAFEKSGLVSTGLDFSNVALHRMKQRGLESEVVLGSGDTLPFPNEYFDYVTCLGSLEHFLYPDVALNEISRVLKTDGLSIIVLPNAYFIKDIYRVWRTGSFPGFGQPLDRYNPLQTWADLIEKNNLKVLKVNKFNPKWRISTLGHLVYRIALPFIPLNLSYLFAFTCKTIK